MPECVQAMGDHDGRPSCGQLLHDFHQIRFRPGVQRAGGLIKDDDRRVPQECASQSDPLSLSARKAGASFSPACRICNLKVWKRFPKRLDIVSASPDMLSSAGLWGLDSTRWNSRNALKLRPTRPGPDGPWIARNYDGRGMLEISSPPH